MNRCDQAIADWHLTDMSPLAETPTSEVYRATSPDHGPVVVKLLKPYGEDEILGVNLLHWLDGDGAARVFDVREMGVLMEFVPGQTLGDMVRRGDDAQAMEIAADMLLALQKPRPHPPGLRALQDQFRSLLGQNPNQWPEEHQQHVRDAIRVAQMLFAEDQAQIPLHGDFHHDNILQSDRGWLVIDPKGLIGDPYYEAANLFQNPVGAGELAQDPARIDHMSRVIANCMGWDRARLLRWAQAHVALSACWHKESGNQADFQFDLLPKLADAVTRAEQGTI